MSTEQRNQGKTIASAAKFLPFLDLLKTQGVSGKLLDLGCGTGRQVLAAAEAGFDAYGIDFSREAIALATRSAAAAQLQATAHFRFGNILQLPYADAEFSVLSDNACLQHISPMDWDLYVQNTTRVLKPGGLFRVRAWSANAEFFTKDKGTLHTDRWTKINGKEWTYFFNEGKKKKMLSQNFSVVSTEEVPLAQDTTKLFWVVLLQKKEVVAE